MTTYPALASPVDSHEQRSEQQTRIYGRQLLLARLGALALAVLTVSVTVLVLPTCVRYLHTVCTDAACPVGQLTPGAVQALEGVGLSVNAFVGYTLALTCLSLLMCWSVAAIIFWRKSDDWLALLVALMLVLMGTAYVTHLVLQRPSPWQTTALLLSTLGFGALYLVFSVFPNGRFVPSWIGWLPISWMAWGGGITVFVHDLPGFYPLYLLALLAGLLGIVGAQLYRYRRVSTRIERQQTKWVVYGASAAMVAVVVVLLPEALIPSLVQQSWPYRLLDAPALTLSLFLGAFSIGMAILRSHLWEIDRLINRTLVYGTLTVTLALIYAGVIIALQFLLRGVISQPNDLTIVLATLAIASVFQPLRRRIQDGIDRRFYRRRYDVARTLEAFSATVRTETDLTQLSERLVATVEQTMHPAIVSIWLLAPTSEADHPHQ